MDFTAPNLQYTYDLSNNLLFKKDSQNYIFSLGIEQLSTIGNVFLLDVHLNKDNTVEPHYHQNASELLYCISGAAVASFINPFTNERKELSIQPGKVASIPQGWWHYATATMDDTHLLAIHDTPSLQTVFGSDILRLTPDKVFAHTYCLDESKVKETLSPIKQTVIIGPPIDCHPREMEQEDQQVHANTLHPQNREYYAVGQNYHIHF